MCWEATPHICWQSTVSTIGAGGVGAAGSRNSPRRQWYVLVIPRAGRPLVGPHNLGQKAGARTTDSVDTVHSLVGQRVEQHVDSQRIATRREPREERRIVALALEGVGDVG